jgi:hypothetical protein
MAKNRGSSSTGTGAQTEYWREAQWVQGSKSHRAHSAAFGAAACDGKVMTVGLRAPTTGLSPDELPMGMKDERPRRGRH